MLINRLERKLFYKRGILNTAFIAIEKQDRSIREGQIDLNRSGTLSAEYAFNCAMERVYTMQREAHW